jgi:hypothetical protein
MSNSILGYFITNHALKRSQQRGISKEDIKDCIKLGKGISQKNDLVYVYNDISVVVDTFTSVIITVKHQYKKIYRVA